MIKVIYNKTCGRCVQSEPLTSGMVGQPIHFEYSHDFDGLTLTAVFTNGKTTVDVLNPGNQCVIPHEVLDTVGTLVSVGIYATRGNELVIPTVYAAVGIVLKGADPSGDVSVDPTLPVWAQIQALMGDLNDLNTEAKNNLVAAINEATQTGSGGASIAMRVNGGYIQYSTDNGKTWVNLIAEADLKGDKGDKGDTGDKGADGVNGVDGKDGAPGKDGKDGTNGITPHIGENGNWYIGNTDTGKPSRGEQGVKGDKGDKGADGAPGAKGDKGDAFTYSDFTAEQLAALKGEKGDTGAIGPQGPKGEQGPKGDTGDVGPQGPQGDKGDPGIPGNDGHSPVVTATKSGKTTTISVDGAAIATVEDGVAGAPGKNGTDGHTPVKGTDYWTASDKAEIVNDTKNAIDLSSYAKLSDLAPLAGTTKDLTPTQVYNAVSAGIPVKVQYTDTTYGLLSFTAFNIAESLSMIVAQAIVYYGGVYTLAELGGNIQAGNWFHKFTVLAEKTDIPSTLPSPNALTIKIGSTTVTYDGSTAQTVTIDDGTEVSY